ncbi:MAG: helix-turn-helix transcriptional regulator [Clostridia bacterium]|nr:helix-turn-helix transcriptional regulator [Clostridia bacterium]
MENKLRFCDNLKELRIDKNLSQKQVALLLKIPVSTYANWEQGRREPNISDIYKIIEIFEVSATELFGK